MNYDKCNYINTSFFVQLKKNRNIVKEYMARKQENEVYN